MRWYSYISGSVLTLAIVALLIAWVSRPDEELVATVGDAGITVQDYRNAYIDYLAETGLPDQPARRTAFLERLVGIELVIVDAKRNGLAASPAFVAAQSRIQDKLKLDYYVQRVVLDTINVTEAELRTMFLRMNTSIKARHLFAQTLEEAAALRGRLESGESFEALAKEVFEDPALAETGGSLGYFGFDEMDPAFEDIAYSIGIGEVSAPVRTSNGYSIVQVEDRQPKPLITENEYATTKDRIASYVRYRRHATAKKNLVAELVESAEPEYYDAGLQVLLGFIQGTVALDGESLALDILSQPLVTFGNGTGGEISRETWSVGDFRTKAQDASPAQRESVKSEALLRQFINGLIAREVMLGSFEMAGWTTADDFERVASKTLDTELYEFAYREHVAKISIPPDSIRAYYDRHKAEFANEPTLLVDEIIVDTRAEGLAARAALRSEPFAAVAARVSVRPGADETGGRLGFVRRGQLGVLGDTLFRTPIGQTIGPIEVAGRYAIFSVVDRAESTPASFEEVRSDVEDILRQTSKRAALRSVVDSLKTVIPVSMDSERVQSIDLRTQPEKVQGL